MFIGDRLKELREHKKLSQGEIEKRTGLLRCYISRVENGHTVPAIETLEKMAHRYIQSNSSLLTVRAAIFAMLRRTRITFATSRRLSLPSQRSRDLNGASRLASTSALTQQFAVN